MFTEITWSSYFVTVLLLFVGYYFIVGYVYYRNDLLQLISTKKSRSDIVEAAQSLAPSVQPLSDEVQAFLNEAGKNKIDKEAIIVSLQMLLKKYHYLIDSDNREPIQDLIIDECKSYCSIHLSEEELNAIWD
jgi:hypothetical protein